MMTASLNLSGEILSRRLERENFHAMTPAARAEYLKVHVAAAKLGARKLTPKRVEQMLKRLA